MTNDNFATAIAKFIRYSNNWKTISAKIDRGDGVMMTESIPEFLTAFPPHMQGHLLAKWKVAYDMAHAYGALLYFYTYLDGEYKRMLTDWINEHQAD